MDCSKSWSVDSVLLAKRMTEILDRPFALAKIIDRGAYATVYQLIDVSTSSASSSSLRRGVQPVVVRVSSRPVYNDVAIDQEKQKILTFVATLDEIRASAPKQVQRRVPQILAYDASQSTEFGHGWIAMTRLAGTPLAECWLDFDQERRNKTIEELAGFTRKLARFRSSHQISSMVARSSFKFGHAMASVSKHNTVVANTPLPTTLSLPRRNGANNLRPFDLQNSRPSGPSNSTAASQPTSTASYLMSAVDTEIAFLRQHQKGAARCFNMNMLRLRQCGLDEEIPTDAALASTTTSIYRKQLKALGDLAQSVVGAGSNSLHSDLDGSEEFLLAHLDLSLENILVDSETGALTGVLDWEFAGFVPAWLALSPPHFITAKEEDLPTWTEDGWTSSILESEQQDEDENEDELAEEEKQALCQLWQDTISSSWEDHTDSANSAKTLNSDIAKEKRMMWKACMSEWHQLGKACAWARGMATSRSAHPGHSVYSDQLNLSDLNASTTDILDGLELQQRIDAHSEQAVGRLEIDLSTTDSDGYTTKEDDDLLGVQARCRSPSTAESSIGPYTPIDAVPAVDLPVVAAGRVIDRQEFDDHAMSYPLSEFKTHGSYSEAADGEDSDEDDDEEEEDSDDDDDDDSRAPINDLDFEEFAMAFEPPPLPHTLSVGTTAPHSTPTSVQLSFSGSRQTVPLPDLSSLSSSIAASTRTSSPASTIPLSRTVSNVPIVSLSLPSPAISALSGPKFAPAPAQVNVKSKAQYKRDFIQWMNSSVPPEQIPSSSLWLAFWEIPKIDVTRDLDFKVERDLDAGW